MVSWDLTDIVILTAIELEYAAVKLVNAGSAPGSGWVEDKHDGLPVALREFLGSHGRHLRIAAARGADMGKGAAIAALLHLETICGPHVPRSR